MLCDLWTFWQLQRPSRRPMTSTVYVSQRHPGPGYIEVDVARSRRHSDMLGSVGLRVFRPQHAARSKSSSSRRLITDTRQLVQTCRWFWRWPINVPVLRGTVSAALLETIVVLAFPVVMRGDYITISVEDATDDTSSRQHDPVTVHISNRRWTCWL